jgi:hypothetical protein
MKHDIFLITDEKIVFEELFEKLDKNIIIKWEPYNQCFSLSQPDSFLQIGNYTEYFANIDNNLKIQILALIKKEENNLYPVFISLGREKKSIDLAINLIQTFANKFNCLLENDMGSIFSREYLLNNFQSSDLWKKPNI